MSTGPKNSWGGKRAGAGRPPGSGRRTGTLSQESVERVLRTTDEFAQKYGLTVDEILCSIAWGVDFAEGASLSTRLKAVVMVMDRTAPRIQEGGIADTHGSPPAELPARNPDPAKVH